MHILILNFVWCVTIGVLSGYCAYYESVLDRFQKNHYMKYINSIIYDIGAFGAAVVNFKPKKIYLF